MNTFQRHNRAIMFFRRLALRYKTFRHNLFVSNTESSYLISSWKKCRKGTNRVLKFSPRTPPIKIISSWRTYTSRSFTPSLWNATKNFFPETVYHFMVYAIYAPKGCSAALQDCGELYCLDEMPLRFSGDVTRNLVVLQLKASQLNQFSLKKNSSNTIMQFMARRLLR